MSARDTAAGLFPPFSARDTAAAFDENSTALAAKYGIDLCDVVSQFRDRYYTSGRRDTASPTHSQGSEPDIEDGQRIRRAI